MTKTKFCRKIAALAIIMAICSFGSSLVQGQTVTARGQNLPNEGIAKLTDGNINSKWLDFSATSWVQFQYSTAQTFNKYDIVSGNDAPERDPKNWTIQGSNNGSTWTTLDTRTSQTWTARNNTRNFTFTNSTAYTYYRWNITANGSGNIIQASEFTFGSSATITGTVAAEFWTNINGTTIPTTWPTTNANQSSTLTSIEIPTNVMENYLVRVRGYIVPSTSGTYNLYIASDDNGELWLSSNDNPANKTRVANVSSWTDSRQWTKETNQKSANINFTAGTKYYFEALMKEGGGGDNLAIGWTGPGITGISVIGSANISTYTATEIIPLTGVSLNQATASVNIGATTTLLATIEPANATNKTVSWTSSNPAIATVNGSGVVTGVAAGTTTITVTTQEGSKTATCAVTVNGTPILIDNKVIMEKWTNVSGTAISAVTWTNNPNTTAILTSLEIPTDAADNYGIRIRGYIVPATSGSYNLYIASDDNGELWLSTNEQPANKSKIATVNYWTSSREWTKEANQKSASIALVANTKYYFEAFMKEGGGGDNLAIGWTGPGITSVTVIGSANISSYNEDTPPAPDTIAPTAPSNLAASSITTSGFSVSWNASTDNVGVVGYEVFVNGASKGTTTTTSFALSGLNASTTYSVTATAKDAAGNVSAQSSTLSVTTSGILNQTIIINKSRQYQQVDGFGAFGSKDNNWGSKTSIHDQAFVDLIIGDLGASIIRTELCGNFEKYNDNSDPDVTNLNAYNIDTHYGEYQEQAQLRPWINYVKDAKTKANALGQDLKIITSIWSPPYWMKYLESYAGTDVTWNRVSNGVGPLPGVPGGKADMYPEYAEYLYAYTQIFKRETGIDLYALSFGNEPAFAQGFPSCVWSADQYRDMLKVVGAKFAANNVPVKLFGQEDIQAIDRITQYINTTGDNMDARKALGIFAVHGYGADGISAGGSDANWIATQIEAAKYNYPLWMTETSGYQDTYEGAMKLANAIHSALYYGKLSAWVWWSYNGESSDQFSLITNNVPTKRYYTSKNFYKYIRPGAVMVDVTSADADIKASAFAHQANKTLTVVLINNSTVAKTVSIGYYTGSNLPASYNIYRTSATENFVQVGSVATSASITLPPQSVTTLYGSHAAQDNGISPSLLTQPASASVPLAGSTAFTVDANGTPNLVFQWYRNGVAIDGEVGRTYTIKAAQQADNGAKYTVKVTNAFGSVTSSEAILTVTSFNGLTLYKIASTPTIDGVADALWNNIPSQSLSKNVIGNPSASDFSGSFKMAWDNTNLYLLINMTDNIPTVGNANGDDVFEVYVDADNSKALSYDANDYQIVFTLGSTTVAETKHNATNGIVVASTKTTTSWIGEVAIPWTTIAVSPAAGKIIGIDVAADDYDGSTRLYKKAWNATSNDLWFNPSYMGIGLLSDVQKSAFEAATFLENADIRMLLFPNPVSDRLTISFGSTIDNANISIFDMQGRAVMSHSVSNTNVESLDVNNLNGGVYMVKVATGNQLIYTRIVKK